MRRQLIEGTGLVHKEVAGLGEKRSDGRKAGGLHSMLVYELPVGIYIVRNGRFEFVNAQFPIYAGYSREELLSRHPLMLVHPEDREMLRENAVQMLKGKRSSAYEYRIITKDGGIRWVTEMVTSIDHGGKRAVLGNCIDITEQKKVEEKLRESEERYRQMFESSPDCIFQIDRKGRLLGVNPAMAASFGVSVKELIGKKLSELVPEEVAQRRLRVVNKAINTGQIQVLEDERQGKHFHNMVIPIQFPGQEQTAQVISRNITELKNGDLALRQSEEQLKQIIDNTWDIIFRVDLEGNFTFGNVAIERVTGYSLDKLLQMNMRELIAHEYEKYVLEQLEKRIAGEFLGQPYDFEIMLKDGHRVMWELVIHQYMRKINW